MFAVNYRFNLSQKFIPPLCVNHKFTVFDYIRTLNRLSDLVRAER